MFCAPGLNPSESATQIVRDPRTHKSKGFGFVSFLDSADFAKALREMQVGAEGGMMEVPRNPALQNFT